MGSGAGDAGQPRARPGSTSGTSGTVSRQGRGAGRAWAERGGGGGLAAPAQPPAARTLFAGPFHGGGKGNWQPHCPSRPPAALKHSGAPVTRCQWELSEVTSEEGLFRKQFEPFKWTGLSDFSGTPAATGSPFKNNLKAINHTCFLHYTRNSWLFFCTLPPPPLFFLSLKLFKHRKSSMSKFGKAVWVI